MRSLTPILEEGVFCLRFGSIGADVTEELFSFGQSSSLKPVAGQMPCSMPASLSPTPVSRRNSGPVGPRQTGNVVSAGIVGIDDVDDAARLHFTGGNVVGGHRRLDRCLSEPTSHAARQNATNAQQQGNRNAVGNSSRYKTELCRAFGETGNCKYGEKCQFAHGEHELRSVSRHRKYKTEKCRTFHTIGFCPYGPRCHFIHNAEEARKPSSPTQRPMSIPGVSSTTSSPTHSDSLSGSPTNYGLFWMPGDEDRLTMESPPNYFHHIHHNNNNNNTIQLNAYQDVDIFVTAKPVTVDFPNFLSGPAVNGVTAGGNGNINLAAPRLPVFSRLAAADNKMDPADR